MDAAETRRNAIGVWHLPHCSNLKYCADRSGTLDIVDVMLKEVARQFVKNNEQVAVGSIGLKSTLASAYVETCRGKQGKRYLKLSVGVLCSSLIPAGLVVARAACNDKSDAFALFTTTATAVRPIAVYADGGNDAEWVHRFWRDLYGTKCFIPPAVHRK